MLEKVNEILHFWFGTDKNNYLANAACWWKKDPAYDQEINERFSQVHQYAVSGRLNEWINQPQSCLAYIILVDQFSRNMYRETPLAFAYDNLALAAFEHGKEQKLDKDLPLVQRLFFYMPLEHSEDIQHQKLCLALMKQLEQEARELAPNYLSLMEQSFDYAQKHYDVIQQFGRFPHRNAILNRESTQEELVFLSLPNSSF
ncbi:DUF924 family protein [Candidatus Berkiella aquae]|uniref:DUF924 domain-containing protein n=1 Tax=Candidatus Berkiella aquae TaxID=295108 RepID=A0A0Q9YKS4_9GAMM|nr:DUF924 family protein [Candidatus Berkiella aquae]MCS5711073.1 DUF924 domain-containing protein [Candidatus Berkiella aquae]